MLKNIILLLLLSSACLAQAPKRSDDMEKGISAFKAKDYKLALSYFDTEARKTRPDAESFYYIGQFYDKGLGGKVKNPREAQTLYQMAAQTEPYSMAAIVELIEIYRTGRSGLAKDPQGAFMWAKTLVNLDKSKQYPDAYYWLAEMHWKGIGTRKNLDEAASLVWSGIANKSKACMAASQALAEETFQAASAAYEKKDYEQALIYYKASGHLGKVEAMLAAGNMYYEGIGTFKFSLYGNDWYDRAAALGNQTAIAKRRAEVTDEHQLYMLKAVLKQADGNFKALPYFYTGKGFLKWDNGETYDGEIWHGTMSGQGKRFYSDGKLWCEGLLRNGKVEYGPVVYNYSNGDSFKGVFIDGQATGYGEMITSKGNYQGMWGKGLLNGTGRLKTPDGTTYWGSYSNGKLEGEGTVIFPDGRCAKGPFVNGEMYGKWNYYNYQTGYLEVRYYSSTGVFTVPEKRESSTDRSDLARAGQEYREWWEKTYGRGGSQNRSAMPNMNIPQASYRTGAQSEAERHQKAMDQIYRDTEKQMRRSFGN